MVHIDESALNNGLCDCASQKPLLRAGGPADYYWIEQRKTSKCIDLSDHKSE